MVDPSGLEDTTLENEIGKRDSAAKTIEIEQEKNISRYSEMTELGKQLQIDLGILGDEIHDYVKSAKKDNLNETQRTLEDGVLTYGNLTPEWSGVDFIKSFFRQVEGFSMRREKEKEFLEKRKDLFETYNAKINELNQKVEISKKIISDAKEIIKETDKKISEIKNGYK